MKNRVLKTVLAAIIGELALALLTTVAQEIIVDGVHIDTSSTYTLLVGGVATFLAGIIAGIIASVIGGRVNPRPHLIITVLIVAETTYLILAGKTGNPLWFAIVSSLALVGSVWVGFYLFKKLK